jgi:hypothetical protein
MSAISIFAPSPPKTRAIPPPIPCPAPVTIATLLASLLTKETSFVQVGVLAFSVAILLDIRLIFVRRLGSCQPFVRFRTRDPVSYSVASDMKDRA